LRHAAQQAIGAWLEADPEPLQVRTLGHFSLQRGERPIENWPRLSSRILFQYLLLHRARPVPVDELIEVLWPHKQLAPSRKNLHQVVTGLRHVLEPELPAGVPSRYLRVAGGSYQLALPPGSTVDDELFLDLCKRADTLRERERAAALYTGDYLPDTLYCEWTTAHRERLSDCHRSLLLRLASDYLEVGRFDECIAAARYAHDQEPWSENAAYLLMSAYAARGERTSALRAYDALQRCLREEFEIAPRPDIVGYYQQILQQ
jgi:DNA-binding SARP family transcriptional activator